MNLVVARLNKLGCEASIINVKGASGSFTLFPAWIMKIIKYLLDSDILFIIFYFAAGFNIKLRAIMELRSKKYDVVHAQDINAFNALSGYCLKKKIKTVLTVHGHFYRGGTSTRSIKDNSWLGRYLLSQELRAFNNAHHIMTVSTYSYQFVSGCVGSYKVSLINNFVDTEEYHPVDGSKTQFLRRKYDFQDDDFVVFYAGQLVERKGLVYVLEGIHQVMDEIPVKLVIAGDGKEKSSLIKYIHKNKIEKMVIFAGEVSSQELIKLYNLSDAFIMASVSGEGTVEGTPMALLEAMACGLPAIVTVVGGMAEVIKHMETGLLVEERNGQGVAHALRILARDKPLRLRMRDNVLTEVDRRFSLGIVIQNILNVYMN